MVACGGSCVVLETTLIEQGIVEPVEQSDWATNYLVVVVKPDGKSVKLCGNYKNTINPVMKVPEFPIPRIDSGSLCLKKLLTK